MQLLRSACVGKGAGPVALIPGLDNLRVGRSVGRCLHPGEGLNLILCALLTFRWTHLGISTKRRAHVSQVVFQGREDNSQLGNAGEEKPTRTVWFCLTTRSLRKKGIQASDTNSSQFLHHPQPWLSLRGPSARSIEGISYFHPRLVRKP